MKLSADQTLLLGFCVKYASEHDCPPAKAVVEHFKGTFTKAQVLEDLEAMRKAGVLIGSVGMGQKNRVCVWLVSEQGQQNAVAAFEAMPAKPAPMTVPALKREVARLTEALAVEQAAHAETLRLFTEVLNAPAEENVA